ncbi:MAG: cheC [Candidatus Peribacteria bacterium]|nr:cheC [Candidatus Peribacteria bacterium]
MEVTLSPLGKDALMEAMNIGAGHAANALSQMTDMKVDISTPRLELIRVEAVSVFTGKPDDIMSVVLVQVLGDAPGVMLLMFPRESALKIAYLLMRKEHALLTEIDRAALREVGNVLAGSCLTSLGNFLKMSFIQSVPNAATDMAGALITSALAEIGKSSEKVLISEVNFMIKELDADGKIFFLFDPSSTQKILDATTKLIP